MVLTAFSILVRLSRLQSVKRHWKLEADDTWTDLKCAFSCVMISNSARMLVFVLVTESSSSQFYCLGRLWEPFSSGYKAQNICKTHISRLHQFVLMYFHKERKYLQASHMWPDMMFFAMMISARLRDVRNVLFLSFLFESYYYWALFTILHNVTAVL